MTVIMTKYIIFFCLAVSVQAYAPRIIGGWTAYAGQFPFAAAIYITTADGSYFCTGSLISNQWILTAGQCVTSAVSFTILLGTTRIQNQDSTTLEVVTETYFLHPEFDELSLENDAGLIKLRQPILFTDYIRPIDILLDEEISPSVATHALGWGRTSDSAAGLTDRLRYVTLITLSNDECRQYYGSYIKENMICAEGNYNEGTCLGDSGSPLFYYERNGEVHQLGISSFISGNGCESTDPSGFTRLSPYVDWISSVTGSN